MSDPLFWYRIERDPYCFVYAEIPKVACTSIKTALAQYLGWPVPAANPLRVHHLPWHRIPAAEIATQGVYAFAFVRHPLDRLASFWARLHGQPPWPWNRDIPRDISFRDFVRYACRPLQNPRAADHHWRPQWTFLYDENGHRLPIEWFRFERLEHDWAFLQRRFDLPPLMHLNQSAHDHWMTLYDEQTATLAFDYYARDFDLLQYPRQFPIPLSI